MKISSLKLLIFLSIAGLILAVSNSMQSSQIDSFHTYIEKQSFVHSGITGFDDPIFIESKICGGCHGYDPTGIASRDTAGNDINLYDDWRASMMGLSAKDPYWRSKMVHETYLIPEYKDDIEETCIKCHAPMGHYEALYKSERYLLDDLYGDTLGLDGVSCMVCHSISEEDLGFSFSGDINFDTFRVAYGPYPFPFEGPMTSFVGIKPLYSFHIFDAGICADCHTLVTNSFDVDGQPTGETFVEQAVYHEWKNSYYNTRDISCQSCHMDELLEPIVVASGINSLAPRDYFRKHNLSGANVQMLTAIKQHKGYLGIDIPDSLFDENIARARDNLENRSVDVEILSSTFDSDGIHIDYRLKNNTGHKLPSGYPARRMYLEMILVDMDGDTLFHSGKRVNHRLIANDGDFENHYDEIDSEDKVQIYQFVTLNSEFERTTSLNMAYIAGKDNRIPPKGFSKSHPSYDTVRIVGFAETDENFNVINNSEGSGTDDINYTISSLSFPLNMNEQYQAVLNVWYESVPLIAIDSILQAGIPASDTLSRVVGDGFDPVLMTSVIQDSIQFSVSNSEFLNKYDFNVYPNPASDKVYVNLGVNWSDYDLSLRDVNGRSVHRINTDKRITSVDVTGLSNGFYWLCVKKQDNIVAMKKLIIYH